jgi:hypothetical protein
MVLALELQRPPETFPMAFNWHHETGLPMPGSLESLDLGTSNLLPPNRLMFSFSIPTGNEHQARAPSEIGPMLWTKKSWSLPSGREELCTRLK